jgi:hypothetical protein
MTHGTVTIAYVAVVCGCGGLGCVVFLLIINFIHLNDEQIIRKRKTKRASTKYKRLYSWCKYTSLFRNL